MGKRKFATEEAKRNNYRYRQKYAKDNYKRIGVQLKKDEDAEIIRWLEEKIENGESYSVLQTRHYVIIMKKANRNLYY